MQVHIPEYASLEELTQALKDLGYDKMTFHVQGVHLEQRKVGYQAEVVIVGSGFIAPKEEQDETDFDRAMKGVD